MSENKTATASAHNSNAQTMADLLQSGAEIKVLKPGDTVPGKILTVGKNEVYVDIEGYGIGVVRGRELYDDQATLASLKRDISAHSVPVYHAIIDRKLNRVPAEHQCTAPMHTSAGLVTGIC